MTQAAEGRHPIRVLYIDDDPAFAALTRKALSRRGHEVAHVKSGAEGLSLLAEGKIDVIALDHMLEGETGFDVLRRLGPRESRPPVVYVTAAIDAQTAIQAIRAGADEYVVKDSAEAFFDLLVVAMEQVLERWRLREVQERNEREVRVARDRAETLLREVNHRIANSLALAAAMVRMQAGALTDPAAVAALNETRRRIIAIAGVHRRLYVSDKVGQVEIDDYLGHLTAELAESLRDTAHDHRIALSAEKFAIPIDKAVTLGVIVGELVTNAFKYAYPHQRRGEIRVAVGRAGAKGFVSVEDDGQGFDAAAPSQGTGLGSKILSAMARTLGATLTQNVGASGVRTRLEFPLA
ncbi:response regulator [uncultured Rhodoblastus sp.]|uniref:sensor histidine kinase n=1 Tax=uncultured Rhodoblastus sp. TaxID=543037 RepID=UPI0025E50559|nr:response regulator [uncultured Rhodoblastus sp.]